MKKKKRTMVEALQNNTWIRDLDYRTSFTTAHLSQFITLWQLVIAAELQQEQEDQITWTQTTHGEYTTASAYKARFSSCVSNPHIAIICKTWAPPKCKFFAWLIVQNKVWTSDLLDHREWTTTHLALCVGQLWRPHITCLHHAATRVGFGVLSHSGPD
jgi:hypothetical protein